LNVNEQYITINVTHNRGGSRIFGGGGLIQGTKLLGGDMLQDAKHAGTRGVWGHAPQENFLK